MVKKNTKQECEYLRSQAKRKFDRVQSTWIDLLRWSQPHRATWLLSQNPGERRNNHIIDPTHILALRSAIAGFLEGNTSASRPWFRIATKDEGRNDNPENKAWLQHYTERVLANINSSNFYGAASIFYGDYHTVNTGAHYFEELENGVHVHTLIPGSYYVLNNSLGEAAMLVREFSLNVMALVDTYATYDENGKPDWSNISENTRKMYEDSNYSTMIDVVHIIKKNPDYNPSNPDDPFNREWIQLTYESGNSKNNTSTESYNYAERETLLSNNKFLRRLTSKRKPFVVGKTTETFEYGEKGPTLDALGLIKSLNKKAISKDQALEQIVSPTLQGPSTLRKSYISSAPNTFIPLDSRSIGQKQKVESVYQISPAIGALIEDTGDLRRLIDKFYYVDFLQFLSSNPKTRTAAEINAVVQEQERLLGPTLQSLNNTYNTPVLEWYMDYTLFEDPFLKPPPESLQGQSLKPEYISVFAQAQKAADLPAIDRYAAMVANAAQINPQILDKINMDVLADLYEDRLYLPAGLNNPQSKVDAMREQAQMAQQRQQALQETIPAIAKAAKDASGIQSAQ